MNFEIKIKTKNLILGAFLGLFIFALGPVPEAQAYHSLDMQVGAITVEPAVIIVGKPVKIFLTVLADNDREINLTQVRDFQVKICAGRLEGNGVVATKDFDNPCITGRQIFLANGQSGTANVENVSVNNARLSINITAAQNSFLDSDTGLAIAIDGKIPFTGFPDHHFIGVSETIPVNVLANENDQDEKEEQSNIGLTVTRQRGGNSFNYTAKINGTPINPSTAAVVKDGVSIPPCACTLKWFTGRSGDRKEATGDANKNPAEFVLEVDVVTVQYRLNSDPSKVYEASALGIKTDQQTASPGNGDSGNPIIGAIAAIISVLVNLIITVVGQITTLLLVPIMRALLSIQVSDAQFASIIVSGWVIVRNIANIFFMLALILISLATLFQVEKYNYKHLLVQVVFMALLVNFSLVIARVILGIADTIQAQFIPFGNPDVINNLAYQLIVKANVNTYSFTEILNGTFSMVVQPIFHLIFALGAFAAFAAITVFLLIRIIAIMLLLVTSPFAYVGRIFGSGQGSNMSSKWWSEFLKYAFFTPILAFFLKLCALIAIQQAALGIYVVQVYPQSSSPVFAQFVYNNLSNVLIIACLFAGLHFAKSQHVAFGDKILDKAKSFAGTPARWAGQGAMYGAGAAKDYAIRKKQDATEQWAKSNEKGLKGFAARNAFRVINPKTAFEARRARIDEKNKNAAEKSKAAATDLTTFAASRGTVKTRHLEREQEKQDAKIKSEYATKTWEELQDDFDKIRQSSFAKTPEGQRRLRMIMESAIETGKFRQLVTDHPEGEGFTMELKDQYFRDNLDLNDPDNKRFLNNISDLGKKEHKLAYIDQDKMGASTASTLPARIEKIVAHVNTMSEADIEKANLEGLGYDSESNKVRMAIAKRLSVLGVPKIPIKLAKQLGVPEITEDGNPVHTDAETQQFFDQLKIDQPDIAVKAYNAAAGVNDPNSLYWQKDIPAGYLKTAVPATVKVHKAGAAIGKKLTDAKNKVQAAQEQKDKEHGEALVINKQLDKTQAAEHSEALEMNKNFDRSQAEALRAANEKMSKEHSEALDINREFDQNKAEEQRRVMEDQRRKDNEAKQGPPKSLYDDNNPPSGI